MQVIKLPLSDTHIFSSFFLDYVDQKEALKKFFNRYPSVENAGAQLAEKAASFSDSSRKLLVASLKKQYTSVKPTVRVSENISLLEDAKTFTVTTGHQLNIFTGPLYFIYKIITVVNACNELKQKYPAHNFVPIYWMASEDHDYDEIKYIQVFGKKFTWHTNQKGPVGRFSPDGLAKLADEVPGYTAVFKDAYSKSKTLSDAVRYYVNALFGDYGVVVLDGDDRALKESLKDVIRDDIFSGVAKSKVDITNQALENAGYKTQIFCRDINFFYMENGVRGRIEKSNGHFRVIDSQLTFSEDDIRQMIESTPEKFSPNVVLRPLYQEILLPNLAYVGGPAEVIYWLQLKGVFDYYSVPFPMIMPRNFGMIVNAEVSRKLDKTGLQLKEIFEEKNFLFNHWVLRHSPRNLTVGPERESVITLFQHLRDRAEQVDKSLSPFVGAEGKRVLNSLEKIERKLLRAEKRLHADKLRQIEFVKDSLFPGGGLQERTDNFLNFHQQDNNFIQQVASAFDPFDYRFHVLMM